MLEIWKIIANVLATGVVMGHTHEPVDVEPGLNYVNTGSWIRYFRQAANDKRSSWALLKKSAYASFPYELAYAEIGEANGRTGAVILNSALHLRLKTSPEADRRDGGSVPSMISQRTCRP